MRVVTKQSELEALTREFAEAPYVAVDTEFMRERTYWPILCLVQIARPAESDDPRAAAIIDPIASDLNLGPLFDLMRDPDTVKVFHAARQDAEIFHHLSGAPPEPLYDTQIAAMVCGFGDQVGYETLVRRIAQTGLDKSSRFTDWARRPLTERQLSYALADVTHLRGIYEHLNKQIERAGRAHWVAEEMAAMADPSTYEVDPDEAWRRLRTRSTSGTFLAIAKELAAWREREAQARDVPRSRLLKDDALLEVCAAQPKNMDDLSKLRLLFREGRKGDVAESILAAVKHGAETPKALQPKPPEGRETRGGANGALSELLRVLLKAKSDEIGVAQKLLASSADLDEIAMADAPETPALLGWRREAFGEDALRLKRGETALSAGVDGVQIVEL
ncbi:MAG: ribonuclease D [Rhodobacteraceae bacterium]|nr:ribonuclease D [Paracoccaceae bacterium]